MGRDATMLNVAVAAYAAASDPRAWLASIIEAAAPSLDGGLGVMAWMFRPPHFLPEHVVGMGGGEDLIDVCLRTTRAIAAASAQTLGRSYTAPRVLETASELSRRVLGFDLDDLPGFADHAHVAGVNDFVGVRALCPSGLGVVLGAPLRSRRRSTRAEREAWMRPAAHLLAGLRLRSGREATQPISAADAVVAPGGKVVHATNDAVQEREALRRAAIAVDRARSAAGRRNPADALQDFRALVSGRWSVVDAFDSDGRRLLVARRNEPALPDLATLTPRETQVACYVALAHPLKHIAYELGIPLSSVAYALRGALHKLGLRGPTELAAMLAPFTVAPPTPPRTVA